MGGCSSFSCKTRGNPCRGDCLQKWWLALLFISNLCIFSINALYSVQHVFHSNIYFSFNSFWITETYYFESDLSLVLIWIALNMKIQHFLVSLFLFVLYFIGAIWQKILSKLGVRIKQLDILDNLQIFPKTKYSVYVACSTHHSLSCFFRFVCFFPVISIFELRTNFYKRSLSVKKRTLFNGMPLLFGLTFLFTGIHLPITQNIMFSTLKPIPLSSMIP